jgi:hypothetical protein
MNCNLKQVKYISLDLRPNDEIQWWESAVSLELLVPEKDVEKLRVALIKILEKED